MFTRSEVIVLTNKHTNKQTDRRRGKQPMLFATLQRWVTSSSAMAERRTELRFPRLR